jgi:hypothetical protein
MLNQVTNTWEGESAHTSYKVIAKAYISHGFFSEPPRSLSGDIQLRLPTTPAKSAVAERLVTSAFTRERPKSQSTPFPLSSIRMLSCREKASMGISYWWKSERHYRFQVTVNYLLRMQVYQAEGYVVKLKISVSACLKSRSPRTHQLKPVKGRMIVDIVSSVAVFHEWHHDKRTLVQNIGSAHHCYRD